MSLRPIENFDDAERVPLNDPPPDPHWLDEAPAPEDPEPRWGQGDQHNRYGDPPPPIDYRSRLTPGGQFILDAPAQPPAVWGSGSNVLWAQGESLLVVGPAGVGKTTLTGQLLRGRLGLADTLLDQPIATGQRRVLYLAMDRPRQIARSLARQFTELERTALDERLVFWPGPPPLDFGKHAGALIEMAITAKADTVVIDSLKDAAVKLSDDEVGGTVNRAIQEATANGIEVLALHHQKKGQGGSKPNTLEDVYGSTWITAGAGSVVLLWGAAGDPLVELIHLKQPADTIGPLKLEHHLDGTTTIYAGFDVLSYLRHRTNGATATDAARAKFETDKPDDTQRKRAQRELDRLVASGIATKTGAQKGGSDGTTAARYYLVEAQR